MARDYIIPDAIAKKLMGNSLEDLLAILLPGNRDLTRGIFFEALRMIYLRQVSRGKILNNKEITHLLNLAHFHQCKKTDILVSQHSPLKILMGNSVDEDRARLWFIDNLASRTITDTFGREIIIRDERIDCIYKDELQQKHTVDPAFFRKYRAKRLPWIKPTLEQSREVYRLDKPRYKCEEFFYVASVTIESPTGVCYRDYYIVLARKKYGKKQLEFITEYPIFNYLDLLKFIERWLPFEPK
ncbi:MAG: hypothetical protein MJA29_03820 [Candidatus Omnitrophica bacterium]|nr:hypothetical protein [Candidatus Omnitrophota bacterium]